jgi:hypothetical protein
MGIPSNQVLPRSVFTSGEQVPRFVDVAVPAGLDSFASAAPSSHGRLRQRRTL